MAIMSWGAARSCTAEMKAASLQPFCLSRCQFVSQRVAPRPAQATASPLSRYSCSFPLWPQDVISSLSLPPCDLVSLHSPRCDHPARPRLVAALGRRVRDAVPREQWGSSQPVQLTGETEAVKETQEEWRRDRARASGEKEQGRGVRNLSISLRLFCQSEQVKQCVSAKTLQEQK